MIRRSRIPALLTSVFLFLTLTALACSSDSGPAGSSSPGPPSGTEKAPQPPAPTIQPGQRKIGEGSFTTAILPGATAGFDPLKLPLDTGVELPPCTAFGFDFGWQVKDPYPPADVNLVWRSSSMEVGSGASGTASVGCGLLEAINKSAFKITLDAHYIIAEIQS